MYSLGFGGSGFRISGSELSDLRLGFEGLGLGI